MKRRILSILSSMTVLTMITMCSSFNVNASEVEQKSIDGSILTLDESSTGYSTPSFARGEYLMTGESTISKAGLTRVYAYAATTANREVNYIATLVYVEEYIEEEDAWGQVAWWAEETHNDYYLSTAKSVKVDRGHYYRVRANHIAGDQYPYDETASATDGIYLP
ncbi:DUF6147 family protein [Mediterraneibacter glycyrrhizinilyticus]|uniref:DUF6147 family protein n=1 Tax=Mediterraneibacter glycyrrhizinilyticus TaxID=342942 RepID=UPI0025AA3B9E|nr:DUF6147 family protein [Mediterraneibacter glycyrrhizinilyticus]MDN0060114.1 DUF6147 family protein [Mediterraneibacter glycyrrhizinilyticus]